MREAKKAGVNTHKRVAILPEPEILAVWDPVEGEKRKTIVKVEKAEKGKQAAKPDSESESESDSDSDAPDDY
jgi:hypothetical protein